MIQQETIKNVQAYTPRYDLSEPVINWQVKRKDENGIWRVFEIQQEETIQLPEVTIINQCDTCKEISRNQLKRKDSLESQKPNIIPITNIEETSEQEGTLENPIQIFDEATTELLEMEYQYSHTSLSFPPGYSYEDEEY